MCDDTISKINARCFGRESSDGRVNESSGRQRYTINAVKRFIDSIVDAGNPDFACSCCVATAGILDTEPDRVFLIASRPDRIARRYAGCRYDRGRGLLLANINGAAIVIRVAGTDGYLYNSGFVRSVLSGVCYTPDGFPVMSERSFIFASLHAKQNMPDVWQKYFLPQRPGDVSKVYFSTVCGKTSKIDWCM